MFSNQQHLLKCVKCIKLVFVSILMIMYIDVFYGMEIKYELCFCLPIQFIIFQIMSRK